MELIKRELQRQEDESLTEEKIHKKYRLYIFLSMFITNFLIMTGVNVETDLQNQVVSNKFQVDEEYEQSLLWAGLVIFIMGQFIDIKNLRNSVIILIVILILYKIITCEDLIFDSNEYQIYLLQAAPIYFACQLILLYIYYVTLFNWYPRKMLFMINGIFSVSTGLSYLMGLAYKAEKVLDPDHTDGDFDEEDDGPYLIVYQSIVIVSCILLCIMIPIHYKYFQIEPLDIGLVMNESSVVIHSEFPELDRKIIQRQYINTQIKRNTKNLRTTYKQRITKRSNENKNSGGTVGGGITAGGDNSLKSRKFRFRASQQQIVEEKSLKRFSLNNNNRLDSYEESLEDQNLYYQQSDVEKTLDEQYITFIKENTGTGLTFYQLIHYQGVFRIILACAFLSAKSIILNIVIYQESINNSQHIEPGTRFILNCVVFKWVIICAEILTGYICMMRFQGRKLHLFYIILMFAFGFDIVGFATDIELGEISEFHLIRFIQLKCQGIFNSIMIFFSLYLMPMDLAKIGLLRYKKKFFGQIFSIILSFYYLVDSILMSNLERLTQYFQSETALTVLLAVNAFLTIPIVFIFYDNLMLERKEIITLNNSMTLQNNSGSRSWVFR